jgi:hypothetical protein
MVTHKDFVFYVTTVINPLDYMATVHTLPLSHYCERRSRATIRMHQTRVTNYHKKMWTL